MRTAIAIAALLLTACAAEVAPPDPAPESADRDADAVEAPRCSPFKVVPGCVGGWLPDGGR
jgi:hypothetical protein